MYTCIYYNRTLSLLSEKLNDKLTLVSTPTISVEFTEGVSQSLPGREFLHWAPSPFGVTVNYT